MTSPTQLKKYIATIAQEREKSLGDSRPMIFDLRKSKDRKTVMSLFQKKLITEVIDDFADQKKELGMVKKPASITHAALSGKAVSDRVFLAEGVWVYYPWQRCLVHILDKREYHMVRTSRNFNLILPREQRAFEKFRIGIAGLNVGNPGAICIALLGGGWDIKLADNDVLSLSNLNRFRAGLPDLGVNKAVLSARQIYEINPFARISVFPNGVSPDTIDDFLGEPKVDLLIEEMDNLKLKIAVRERARTMKIPVLMVTGNGPNVIIDVERFDQNPRLPLLSGHLSSRVIKGIQGIAPGKGTMRERVLLARDFMGVRHLHERLPKAFLLVGSRLAGIPQIAESSFLRGAALCYFARQIAVGARVPSGRYILQMDSIIR